MATSKVSLNIPTNIFKEMDFFIDGVVIRNRSQFILIAITEYMERQRTKGEQLNIKPIKKRKQK